MADTIYRQGIRLGGSFSPDDVSCARRKMLAEVGHSVLTHIYHHGPATVYVHVVEPDCSTGEPYVEAIARLEEQ